MRNRLYVSLAIFTLSSALWGCEPKEEESIDEEYNYTRRKELASGELIRMYQSNQTGRTPTSEGSLSSWKLEADIDDNNRLYFTNYNGVDTMTKYKGTTSSKVSHYMSSQDIPVTIIIEGNNPPEGVPKMIIVFFLDPSYNITHELY